MSLKSKVLALAAMTSAITAGINEPIRGAYAPRIKHKTPLTKAQKLRRAKTKAARKARKKQRKLTRCK